MRLKVPKKKKIFLIEVAVKESRNGFLAALGSSQEDLVAPETRRLNLAAQEDSTLAAELENCNSLAKRYVQGI